MHDPIMTFLFRLPTSKEYEQMLSVTASQDTRCHWSSIYTLCSDEDPTHAGLYIARGFTASTAADAVSGDFSNVRLGFRPFLAVTHTDPFPALLPGSFVHFGCLCLNGLPTHYPVNPVSPSGFYMGDIPKAYDAIIQLLDAPQCQQPIGWIKLPGGYIADRVLLCRISRNALFKQGLGEGREVTLTRPSLDLT